MCMDVFVYCWSHLYWNKSLNSLSVKESSQCFPEFEELVSKTSFIHSNMLLIFIIDFILQLKKYMHVCIADVFHLMNSSLCAKWFKVEICDTPKYTEEVFETNKTLFLCFSIYVCILWQGHKAVLTIVNCSTNVSEQ